MAPQPWLCGGLQSTPLDGAQTALGRLAVVLHVMTHICLSACGYPAGLMHIVRSHLTSSLVICL